MVVMETATIGKKVLYVDNTSLETTTLTVPDCELTISSHSEYIDYYNITFTYDYKPEYDYYDRLKQIKQGWKCPVKIGNVMGTKYRYKNLNIRDNLPRNKIRINEIAA